MNILRSLRDLDKYSVCATDGDLGHVDHFLIDDEQWAVRYLVVESGGFRDRRGVLITPNAFRRADVESQRFHLALTLNQIRSSPDIDTDKPVSRQHESECLGYYVYTPYWDQPALLGIGLNPVWLAGSKPYDVPTASAAVPAGDAHLRSADELRGYHIHGCDGAIGHVNDFLLDDESWAVRFLVIDTSAWWFGKKVLVAPRWADSVSCADRTIHLGISRTAVQNSPEWHPNAPVTRAVEHRRHDYYGRPVYSAIDGHGHEAQPQTRVATPT